MAPMLDALLRTASARFVRHQKETAGTHAGGF